MLPPPPAAPPYPLPWLTFTSALDLQATLLFLHPPKTSRASPASLKQGLMCFILFQNVLQAASRQQQQEQVLRYHSPSQAAYPMHNCPVSTHASGCLPTLVLKMTAALSGPAVRLYSLSLFQTTVLFPAHFGKMKVALLSSPLTPWQAESCFPQGTRMFPWIKKA